MNALLAGTEHGRTGLISAEDLCVAVDWAGPGATVGHAVTQALVDLVADDHHCSPTHLEEP